METQCDLGGSRLLKILEMHEDIPKSVLRDCSLYAISKKEIEACGLVLGSEEKTFYPTENLDASPESFEIDPRIQLIRHKIFCLFHSHPLASAAPSDADICSAKAIQLPYLIYSVIHDNFIYFDLKKCIPIKV